MRLFSTFLLVPLMLISAANAGADASLDNIRQQIAEKFPNFQADEISRTPVPGIIEVRQGAMVAYLSEDGRYLLRGELIDLDADQNLTEVAEAEGRKTLLADLTDGDGVLFAPAEPRHTVTVFTDIDCTFCRKLHREIQSYNDAGIAVRYLMYPRSGPNTRSWEKAEEVWCAEDRRQALTRAKNDEALPAADCDASMVRRHFETGLRVGLNGTPAIVTETGDLIAGYLPAEALVARLEASADD